MEKWMFLNKKSQSLIESVVAISIVVIAVIGIMSVGLTSVSLGGQSEERVVAINLAREGIEIVSAVRNSNLLDPGQSWPYGLIDGFYRVGFDPTTGLKMDADAEFNGGTGVEHCDNCGICQHFKDEYYYHDDNCPIWSPFHRLVTIATCVDELDGCVSPADREKKVISSVYWEERGRPHIISIESRFTDWR